MAPAGPFHAAYVLGSCPALPQERAMAATALTAASIVLELAEAALTCVAAGALGGRASGR